MSFSGKHIWLVGASEGIGASLATRLANDGARLTLSARNTAKLEELRASLPGSNHAVVGIDVTSPESVLAAWQQLATPIDTVIYNAGYYEPMDASVMNLEIAERMLNVNLLGAFRVVAASIPAFVSRKSGHIALVGSVAGYRGLPAAIGYGASKAGLIHFAENLRADLARHGIKVQVLNPGFVKTRLTEKNDFPMPFIITPEKAAEYMFAGLSTSRFETHFPRRFSYILKTLAALPYPLYFWLMSRIKL
ncbi:MAG: SDR family NAD(P)-dependent oxidoreductase [Rickettsiales bacterium]|nr:SDR family NAD(P)-dependent oxidoreductase [Rickettsiales bacterium]